MKIFIILTIILIVIFIITMIKKSKKINNVILKEETKILSKYFGAKIYDDVKDLESLKNNLDINPSYRKDLEAIVLKVKHDYEILYSRNIKLNRAYPDSHVYNIITNTVLSYSMRNNITIKKAIKLFILTITAEYIQEQLTDELSKEEELENFYTVLASFVKKFNAENKDK